MLESIQLQTSTLVDYTVIWLHGLGADGHDFESIVDELELPHTLGIRFLFPHAPMRSVTINGGMRMRAWFDIESLELDQNLDLTGITKSAAQVTELIEREISRGIPSTRIVLAGFSQGGLIALHLGLRYSRPLAGIIALSTYEPTLALLTKDQIESNKATPIFIGHGSLDPVVPLHLGRAACASLEKLGQKPDFHSYMMPHSVCPDEFRDISQWLEWCFA